MQDYAGGTRQLYRGKNPGIAEERKRALMRSGWPANTFVTVEAMSLAEAHDKAQAILWKRLHIDARRVLKSEQTTTEEE
jgi:hypothetical protein